MFLLSRRQAHAAAAGAAAAAAWLAAAELSSKRPVRVGGLFVLSSMAMAGMATGVLSSRASAKALAVEARFTNLINNGGSFGGDIHVVGDHYVTGAEHVTGALNAGTTSVGGLTCTSHTVNGNQTINGNSDLTGGTLQHIGAMNDNGGGFTVSIGGTVTFSGGQLHGSGLVSAGTGLVAGGAVSASNTTGQSALAGESSGWENGAQIRINDFISALG